MTPYRSLDEEEELIRYILPLLCVMPPEITNIIANVVVITNMTSTVRRTWHCTQKKNVSHQFFFFIQASLGLPASTYDPLSSTFHKVLLSEAQQLCHQFLSSTFTHYTQNTHTFVTHYKSTNTRQQPQALTQEVCSAFKHVAGPSITSLVFLHSYTPSSFMCIW